MANWISSDGEIANVSPDDRGLQYGDGLFETIAIRNGKPRLWQYHMDRLRKGCDVLGISAPADTELSQGVMRAVASNNVSAAYSVAKVIVSAGAAARGYGRSKVAAPAVIFGAFPAAPPPIDSYRDGIEIAVCKTRLGVNSALSGLKTLNRLEQVLARSEIADSNVFEGLTLDADGNIICCTMSNVFIVSKQSIATPSLDRCGVEGVMRRHVIESLNVRGIASEIRTITMTELRESDEVFITNSQFGIMPVHRCMTTDWTSLEVTRNVMNILADNGIAECRL